MKDTPKKHDRRSYPFRVVAVRPHSLVVLIEDAASKKYQVSFGRELFTKAGADKVGAKGEMFCSEKKGIRLLIHSRGGKRKPKRPGRFELRELKFLEEFARISGLRGHLRHCHPR